MDGYELICGTYRMKAKILVGALLWTLLVTVAHVWANVGFANFTSGVKAMLGLERVRLTVGFLPVT